MHTEKAILFADLAGSTSLYQQAGDERAHLLVTRSLSLMKNLIESSNGTLLRTVGDAALASFNSADDAFSASVAMQNAHADTSLSIRIGFHFGEVIADDGDVYGNAVNIAARVANYANANEICVTYSIISRLSITNRNQSALIDRAYFKGVEEPMRVFRVDWDANDNATHIVTGKMSADLYQTDKELSVSFKSRSRILTMDTEKISFGRSLDNDFLVEHESTSRYHAKIEFVKGRFVINDSSTNGTYVQISGRKVEFIHREEFVLADFGLIGLGWNPELEDGVASLKYRLLSQNV